MTNPQFASKGRWWRRLGALVVLAAVGVLGFWAGQVVLLSPKDPLEAQSEPITYTVAEGEVGRSLRFATIAEWELTPLARNPAAGVVTAVEFVSGEVATSGQVLYSVDLRPVVVAEGAVPAFRSLQLNAQGPDVAQLQQMLSDLDHFTGDPDGVFRTSTRTAVRLWQRSLGVTDDGIVRLGDIVFVRSLPARIALESTVVPGTPLAGGEQLVLLVPEAPEFRVPLATEQRTVVPLDALVRVTYADGVWDGRVDRAVEDPSLGLVNLILTALDGGPLCGSDCSRWVELHAPTDFGVEIIVLPRMVGPAVPAAAIHSDAGNQTYVMTAGGAEVAVTVIASAQGIAIVDGIDEGTVILLPVAPPADQ